MLAIIREQLKSNWLIEYESDVKMFVTAQFYQYIYANFRMQLVVLDEEGKTILLTSTLLNLAMFYSIPLICLARNYFPIRRTCKRHTTFVNCCYCFRKVLFQLVSLLLEVSLAWKSISCQTYKGNRAKNSQFSQGVPV